jgi:beta-lactam-binding protein with PASTA domain
VKGLTIDQAKAALHLAGLEVKGPRISIATSLVPRRHVVGTSPSRFRDGKPRTIPRGTAIQLKVSTGP